MRKVNPPVGTVAAVLAAFCFYVEPVGTLYAQAPAGTVAPESLDTLRAEIERLKTLVPDQAHAMADVDYHFSNLWFAAEKQNWQLAKFYLDETKSHLNWAVRIRPLRKTAAGQEIDLKAILQKLETSSFEELKKAVDGKNSATFATVYRQTLDACYSCHVASEKPFLRIHVPESPATRMIQLVPAASADSEGKPKGS